MTAVQDPNGCDFNQLADTLLEVLHHTNPDHHATRCALVAQQLRTAYQRGLIEGVELAAEGLQLAAALDHDTNPDPLRDEPVEGIPASAIVPEGEVPR